MGRLRKAGLGCLVLLVLAVGGFFALGAVSRASRPKIAGNVLARAAEPAVPSPGSPSVWIAWTGVAGLRIEADDAPPPMAGQPLPGSVHTLLVDPWVTRHAVTELARPVDSDTDTAARAFPRADAILIGHSHHDHLGDAPAIALRTGARIYGTSTTCAISVALGLPAERCTPVEDGAKFTSGPFDVEVVAHAHGESPLGVPFPGTVEHAEPGLFYIWNMKMGGALAFVVRAHGRTVYSQGSAGLTDAQLARVGGLAPDVAAICLALRQHTPDFEQRLLGALQPKAVLPTHQDDFFGAVLSDDFERLPGVDDTGFAAQVRKLAPAAVLLTPKPFERVRVP